MTIFEFLNIPDTYPIYIMDNRFYAYKDLLIDLHNNTQIKLKKPTKNNTLLQQLNIPFIIDNIEYITIHIKQLNLTVHYNQDVNTSWFIAHTDKNNTILYYKNNKNDIQLTNNISENIQNMVNFYINK